jgi:hypothetical protein
MEMVRAASSFELNCGRLTQILLVCDGDSGAWVVHSSAPLLYGHVVATDSFGDAYVIPAPDTFNNIKECMGAISVELPGLKEIEAIHETEPILPAQELTESGKKSQDHLHKQWNPIFSRFRYFTEDQPYVPSLQKLHADGDHLERFLSIYNTGPPSLCTEEINAFVMQDSGASSTSRLDRAWLDDRSLRKKSSTAYRHRLTAQELYQSLLQKVSKSMAGGPTYH